MVCDVYDCASWCSSVCPSEFAYLIFCLSRLLTDWLTSVSVVFYWPFSMWVNVFCWSVKHQRCAVIMHEQLILVVSKKTITSSQWPMQKTQNPDPDKGVSVCLFSFTAFFVSISQVIGCEDRLQNDLYCVGWGVKLYSLTHSLIKNM